MLDTAIVCLTMGPRIYTPVRAERVRFTLWKTGKRRGQRRVLRTAVRPEPIRVESIEPEIIATGILDRCREFFGTRVPQSIDPLAGALALLWEARKEDDQEERFRAQASAANASQLIDLNERLKRGMLSDAMTVLGISKAKRDAYLRGAVKAADRRKLTWDLVDFVAAGCTSLHAPEGNRDTLPRLHQAYVTFCEGRGRAPLGYRAFAAEIRRCGGVKRFKATAPGGKRLTGYMGIARLKNR